MGNFTAKLVDETDATNVASVVGRYFERYGQTSTASGDFFLAKELVDYFSAVLNRGGNGGDAPPDMGEPGPMPGVTRREELLLRAFTFPNESRFDRLATEAALRRELRPWTEFVRTELFGGPEPPFAGDETAAKAWLSEEDRYSPSDEDLGREVALEGEIIRAATNLERHTGDEVHWERRPARLESWNEDLDRFITLTVRPGTPHARLAAEVQKMTEATGFGTTGLTMHVLTGSKPTLLPVIPTRHVREWPSEASRLPLYAGFVEPGPPAFSNSFLTLRINTPLSTASLTKVRSAIDKTWKETPDRRLVRKLVADWENRSGRWRESGGLPPRKILSRREDWEEVLAAWVDEGKKPKLWTALMMLHRDATKSTKKDEPEYAPVDAAALERFYDLLSEAEDNRYTAAQRGGRSQTRG